MSARPPPNSYERGPGSALYLLERLANNLRLSRDLVNGNLFKQSFSLC